MRNGWRTKTIGDACQLMTGGTPSRTSKDYFDGEIPWLVSGDIHRGEIFECDGRISDSGMKASNAKLLPINSVMIALNGQGKTRGTVALLRSPATCNQSLVSIYPKNLDELMPEFLYANLHGRYQEIRQMTGDSGNDRRGLNMNLIRSIKIPIAPLPEQKRIVAILDEAFEGIATAKANAEKNLKNARAIFESYVQSVFSQGCRGWVKRTLKDICEKITDGTHQTPTYYETGIVFLSSRNVTSGRINWDNIKYIDAKQHAEMHKRVAPRLNDILLAKNGTTGVAAIVDREVPFDIYVSLALLRAKGEILPPLLLHFINSPVAKKQFNKRLKGIGVPNLHLEEIREVVISFPTSLAEQKTIAEKLDEFRDETQRLADVYERKLAALNALKKSLLHHAFAGELTVNRTSELIEAVA
jgi:type I restriction enzyme, S subunit